MRIVGGYSSFCEGYLEAFIFIKNIDGILLHAMQFFQHFSVNYFILNPFQLVSKYFSIHKIIVISKVVSLFSDKRYGKKRKKQIMLFQFRITLLMRQCLKRLNYLTSSVFIFIADSDISYQIKISYIYNNSIFRWT